MIKTFIYKNKTEFVLYVSLLFFSNFWGIKTTLKFKNAIYSTQTYRQINSQITSIEII